MYTCNVCGYKTDRYFNYLRHKKNKHGTEQEEDSMANSESEKNSEDTESMSESEYSNRSETTSESEQSEDTSEESDEVETSPWYEIVNKTFQMYMPEYIERVNELEEAGHKNPREAAYQDMFKLYRDEIGKQYLERVFWHNDMKRDPVHRKIKSTAKRLREDDEYEIDESWKYAFKKRKFLVDNVLNDYNPPSDEDSDDSMVQMLRPGRQGKRGEKK